MSVFFFLLSLRCIGSGELIPAAPAVAPSRQCTAYTFYFPSLLLTGSCELVGFWSAKHAQQHPMLMKSHIRLNMILPVLCCVGMLVRCLVNLNLVHKVYQPPVLDIVLYLLSSMPRVCLLSCRYVGAMRGSLTWMTHDSPHTVSPHITLLCFS